MLPKPNCSQKMRWHLLSWFVKTFLFFLALIKNYKSLSLQYALHCHINNECLFFFAEKKKSIINSLNILSQNKKQDTNGPYVILTFNF